MIVDLSHPTRSSVNDGIIPALCSLGHSSVDQAVRIVRQLGKGTRLVMLDIRDAYHIVPVHLADYRLWYSLEGEDIISIVLYPLA